MSDSTSSHTVLITEMAVNMSDPMSSRIVLITEEALPGALGNRGKRVFISGGQGNKDQILRGNGEQRQYWGTGNIRKQFIDFWETREQVNLIQGNKGTGTPLGGPH